MMRRFSRLVALLTLVAYLASNTHLGLGLTACAAAVRSTAAAQPEEEAAPPTTCKHCLAKKKKAFRSARTAEKKKHDSSCVGCRDCIGEPSCPCCPTDQDNCPVPGGCSMCNLAKAPLLDAAPALDLFLTPAFERVVDRSISYLQPSSDSMIRPPRA